VESFRIRTTLAVDYTEATVEWEQFSDDRGLRFWHLGEAVKLQVIRRLCNKLLMIMLNTVDELTKSCTVDIRELLIQKLSAAKNLSKLGGDECDNLKFMNVKIDNCFKIRKNSWTFKIHKIRILNL